MRNRALQENIDLLTEARISYEILRHEPVITMDDAKTVLSSLPYAFIKTMALRSRSTGEVLLCGMMAQDAIDTKKVSQQIGCSRSSIQFASQHDVEELLGAQVGGIGPISSRKNVRTFLDERLIEEGLICCGIGSNERTLQISFDDLAKVSSALVTDIVRNRK